MGARRHARAGFLAGRARRILHMHILRGHFRVIARWEGPASFIRRAPGRWLQASASRITGENKADTYDCRAFAAGRDVKMGRRGGAGGLRDADAQ